MVDLPSQEELRELAKLIDSWPLLGGTGPLTAEEDENGVVFLKDKDGNIRYLMSKATYVELLEYRKAGEVL